MHISKPRIVRQEVKGQSSGGKGGKKKQPKQYQERVFRSYAIRICEGPITAIMRVWRNNKLVYDARGNDWGDKNNGVFLKLARFYLGGWDQMPDPTLESIWGAGDVPGYRGTCYMVVSDEDLTDLGGTVPQYTFEVERAEGRYLTSRPYAAEDIQGLELSASDLREGTSVFNRDAVDMPGASVVDGSLRVVLKAYNGYLPEAVDMPGASVVSGAIVRGAGYVTYSDALPEGVDMPGALITSGSITRVAGYIGYTMRNEAVDMPGASITGGSLE
jgi:hypothetical protein